VQAFRFEEKVDELSDVSFPPFEKKKAIIFWQNVLLFLEEKPFLSHNNRK
jgi:hypothetical protein